MKVRGDGPIPTRIMLIGEIPSVDKNGNLCLFPSHVEAELNKMLQESGIMRSECYVTSACKTRPATGQVSELVAGTKKEVTSQHIALLDKMVLPTVKEGYLELLAEIAMVQPNLIIALGNLPMWLLTGNWSILKWRGSMLETDSKIKVIPTISPAAVMREWKLRALVVRDFRRAKKEVATKTYLRPEWNFITTPSFETARNTLALLIERCSCFGGEPQWLDFDIETRNGHIDCIGLSWSRLDAICIPFISRRSKTGYWAEAEEAHLVWMLLHLLSHDNVRVRWQNGLYDAQYVHRWWHFVPRGAHDTMITQHSCFAALPKGLAFLGSMYSDWYRYWKDEGKIASDAPEDQRWTYNLQDCVYTRETGEVLLQTAASLGLKEVDENQQALFYPVLRAMLRGVRVIPEAKAKMAMEIQEELSAREAFFYFILGHQINIDSPKQMQTLFYEDLKQPTIYNRVFIKGRQVMRPTCDDEALQQIGAREPLLKPLCDCIADIRTLGKFLKDFVMMPLDEDLRMRCSFNIAGDAGGKSAPYSYRLSSSKNPFGSGGNLQTIPSEKSKSSGKAAARGSMDFTLPNIRSMYGPDPGFTFFDMDLDRADLQVVVRESGEPAWISAMDAGVDMHLLNVFTLDGKEPPPYEELVETHPRYPDHRGPRKHKREFAKVFCHATNYVGGAKTVAAHTGRSVHEIDRAQKAWFEAHPGIKKWHERVSEQIERRRFVENRFGYRWYIFDRIDGLLPEAVAWIPQSTVGIVINKIWRAFYEQLPEVQVLLQVHDSLAGQFPTHRSAVVLPKMQAASRIVIPYEHPLIIPTGIKTSTASWGDCA